jgi:hypothetical protein
MLTYFLICYLIGFIVVPITFRLMEQTKLPIILLFLTGLFWPVMFIYIILCFLVEVARFEI